jgi:hypothetical protein
MGLRAVHNQTEYLEYSSAHLLPLDVPVYKYNFTAQ